MRRRPQTKRVAQCRVLSEEMSFLGLPEGFDLKYTWRLLCKYSEHPFWDMARLLWPIPWYLPPRLPLPRPQELIHDTGLFDRRYPLIPQIRLVSLFVGRDSPQASFYRIYEAFCCRKMAAVSSETEYFWRRAGPRWLACEIPDPQDEDPIRYAVLASLAEALVDSFNWRLELGLRRGRQPWVERADDGTPAPWIPEELPSWTRNVPALEDELVISPDGTGPLFKKRNIIAFEGDLHTV